MTRPLSNAWFVEQQGLLLWLINHWLTRRWFRWVLCIRPHDAGYRGRIVALRGHSYTLERSPGHYTTDFRTNRKYARRLYYAFRPLWLLAHVWDEVIAKPMIPAWYLGCTTLTAYPDPDPETTTVDGVTHREEVTENWATIQAGAGNGSADATGAPNFFCQNRSRSTTDDFRSLSRGIFLFDTSSIGSDDIDDATLSLYGHSNTFNSWTLTDWGLNIYSSGPASDTALVNADFATLGTTAFSSAIVFGSWSTSGYNDFTLNASGESNINKSGVSDFGSRESTYDAPDSSPVWESNVSMHMDGICAENGGTTADPKLVVNHSAAGGGGGVSKMMLLGI